MFQSVGDIAVFGLTGDLDLLEGRSLMRSLGRMIHHEWVKIVLDFERVEHVNYQVLAQLVRAAVVSHALQGRIKLANMTSYHRNLLRVAGVEEFFETYGSLGEAILSFADEFTSPTSPC